MNIMVCWTPDVLRRIQGNKCSILLPICAFTTPVHFYMHTSRMYYITLGSKKIDQATRMVSAKYWH